MAENIIITKSKRTRFESTEPKKTTHHCRKWSFVDVDSRKKRIETGESHWDIAYR